MVKSGRKLDFWFWVKVGVVGFMLIFLISPFCTLITRSFFSSKVDGFTLENYIRFFTKKYYYSALGRSPVHIHCDNLYYAGGGRSHCLCDVQV